jgi:hypothetical protein
MTNDYRDYVERWKRINAFQAAELHRTPVAARVRQFFTLLEMARKMGWRTSTPEEIEEVRSRWKKLKGYSG